MTPSAAVVTIGTPMSKGRAKSISDVLRQAIADSGLTYSELERATGVKRASIMRFVRGDRSMRLDMADRLAQHLRVKARTDANSPKGDKGATRP